MCRAGLGLQGLFLLPPSSACRLGRLSLRGIGAPTEYLPSQHDGQGPGKQCSKEAPQGVQRHNEGPHKQN